MFDIWDQDYQGRPKVKYVNILGETKPTDISRVV